MAPTVRKLQSIRRKRQIARNKVRLLALYIMWQLNQVHRVFWVHPLNNELGEKGQLYTHYADHCKYPERFFQLYRMTVRKFDELLFKVSPYLTKKETNLRETICAEQRLIITIR